MGRNHTIAKCSVSDKNLKRIICTKLIIETHYLLVVPNPCDNLTKATTIPAMQ